MKRVVITGIGAVTAFGKTWEDVKAAFQRKQNAVQAKTSDGQNSSAPPASIIGIKPCLIDS